MTNALRVWKMWHTNTKMYCYFKLSAKTVNALINYNGHNMYSVKRSDVTRSKQGYITPPPPYFILWNEVTSLGENKVK